MKVNLSNNLPLQLKLNLMKIPFPSNKRYNAYSSAVLAIFIFLNVVPQVSEAQKTFLRLFDTEGRLLMKGKIVAVTDSSITFKKGLQVVSIEEVDVIRTRRSIGNSMLTGALVFGGAGAAIGAVSADQTESNMFFDFTPAEGAATGFLIGNIFGAFAGMVNGIVKPRKVFTIQGKRNLWLPVKEMLEESL